MGFNNGYDSGYSDCEAENRKRWEREAVERYKAENPPGESSGDISPAPPGDDLPHRAAKVFTISSTTSVDLVYTDEYVGYDVTVSLDPFEGNSMGLLNSHVLTIDNTLTGSWEGNTWTPTAPEGGWVVGDSIVFNLVRVTERTWGPFAIVLGDMPVDDIAGWRAFGDTDPFMITYAGNGHWFGGWSCYSA